jgi:hypothetical protein
MHMTIATQARAATKKLHTRYSAYLDVPSIVPATDAVNLIRYVEFVVAYRHPELHLLSFDPGDSGQVATAPSNFCRYPFHIDVSTRPETRSDLLDAIIVDAGQALAAHCKPRDGRRPGVGLSTSVSSLVSEPGCPWCPTASATFALVAR